MQHLCSPDQGLIIMWFSIGAGVGMLAYHVAKG
jgi:hypothetical protein